MKKFIICLPLALLFIGCTEDNPKNNEVPNNNPSDNNPPVVQKQEVFPKQIIVEHSGATINERVYEVKDNKVVSITFKTYLKEKKDDLQKEFREVFTYENNLPKSSLVTDLKNNKTISKETYHYQNGKLTEKIKETFANNSVRKYTVSYKYNGEKLSEIQEKYDEGTSVVITYSYPSSTEILAEQVVTANQNGVVETQNTNIHYTLDAQQRVVKFVRETSTYTTTQEFQYDNKNNYRYNTIDLIKNPDYFIKPTFVKNNVVNSSYVLKNNSTGEVETTYITTYQYQYNNQGYPVSIIENDDVDTITTTITY